MSNYYLYRINFYLGGCTKDIEKNTKLDSYSFTESEYFHKFENIDGLLKKIYKMNDNPHTNDYLIPFYKILSRCKINPNKMFFVLTGDNECINLTPSFTKNRINDNDDNKGAILRCMSFQRHWNSYYNKPRDINFENKYNKIIWRGTTTGNENRHGNRFTLVKSWHNKNKNIDIGFSSICQRKDNYKIYLKNYISIPDMLQYKYIISAEGNDKDTGINWKLNSNSLVLMPKPRISSWLMETTLIPNYHYVLLADDFSDLEEKYIWCENNQSKCKEIIKNANNFMKQFSNDTVEQIIERSVIRRYFEIYS